MHALGKRPRARAAVSFRCIKFSFATKQDTQEARSTWTSRHCRGNKHRKPRPFACPRLMRISYMKSILGGPWLLGAQGSRLPLPNG